MSDPVQGRDALVVHGSLRVPGDKSISHRALMFAALAPGRSRVSGLLLSADVRSTARVLSQLGASLPPVDLSMDIAGRGAAVLHSPLEALDCGNSGTTTRLVAGIVAGSAGVRARFEGDESLSARPMRRVAKPLEAMGAHVELSPAGTLPMTVTGSTLHELEWTLEQASAQVKSAVLLASVVAGVPVTVREHHATRDHTERMLEARGVAITRTGDTIRCVPSGPLAPRDVQVPGDPSSAAFFVALAAMASDGELRLVDVLLNPTRTGFLEVVRRMGADVEVIGPHTVDGEPIGTLVVRPSNLRATDIGGAEIPTLIDELPVIAALASVADGETRITGAAELRAKESDRIAVMVENLRAIGVDAEELPDGLIVRGPSARLVGRVSTHGDHRIAMAFGVLAARPDAAISIDVPGCVDVSYPSFWGDLATVTASTRATAVHFATVSGALRSHFVIAIDGPAASGKSSTARWVAERLGLRHVDSGALYRALTALAHREFGAVAEQWNVDAVLALGDRIALRAIDLGFEPLIDGTPADDELRGAAVTREVSRVAQWPMAREWVNARVRLAARASDVVVDGRDIGTVVFPDAALKVFLVADPWERARRRLIQRLGRRPTDVEVAEETERLVARDAKDQTQSVQARDAVLVDTTALTQEEQVERIVALAEVARGRAAGARVSTDTPALGNPAVHRPD
ncbi:MAG: 3-phosphoshikimate 1-carboxyvinyltransferase [Gemmatimonadaceae bacterium]|jgi:3-phosphoshikimate 1-carboxyvinyltransferase|nr:3-phosphoshikimate 1-carboxyvinyltransferase [Gemmatimonadaceae bacterium]